MANDPGAECPKCGFWTEKKLIKQAPGVHFVGYNWPDKSISKTMADVTKEQRKRDEKRDWKEYNKVYHGVESETPIK